MSDDPFLSRWSRLKRAAKSAPAGTEAAPKAQATPVAPAASPEAPPGLRAEPAPLPPVESLTPESDFSPFMQARVDEALRRRALKALFDDPRFNVMDGLDTYIADYSQPDPLPEGWLEKMGQMAHLGDQPARIEAERRAAEEAQPAAAETGREAPDSLPDEEPATSRGLAPSDTSNPVDEVPPVGESQREGGRLT